MGRHLRIWCVLVGMTTAVTGAPVVSLDYHLISDAKEFRLGTTVPQTGSVSMIGRDFLYGANLVFNKLNATGGVNGITIKFATLDDHYEPSVAVTNVTELLNQSPILFGLFGSESFTALYPKIKQQQLVSIFPFVGDVLFRENPPRMSTYLRASLEQEIEALVGYASQKMQRRKIAIFYESSTWGEGALKIAERVLEHYGLELCGKGLYRKNTVNVSSAVSDIVAAGPDAVLCIAHSRPAYDFIKMSFSGTERSSGLQNCLFLGVGEMAPIQDIINDARGVKLVLSSVVPSPWKSDLQIVKQFRKDAKKYLPNREISQPMLEGYLAAKVLTAALKELSPTATLGDLLQYFESLASTNFGGIKLRFNAADRTLCHDVWLNLGIDKTWPKAVFKPKAATPHKESA